MTGRGKKIGYLPADLRLAAMRSVGDCSVGLVRLETIQLREHGQPIGTATLVQLDGVPGLLTAGHVVAAMAPDGRLGVVRFTNDQKMQAMRLDMSLIEPVALGTRPYEGNLGPDIGFLRLPSEDAARLAATNVFLNLTKQEASDNHASSGLPQLDALIGVIAEDAATVSDEPGLRMMSLPSHMWPGRIGEPRMHNGYDLFDIAVMADPDEKIPTSFGGTSGGGVWRIVFNESATEMVSRSLVGVAFWEAATRPPVITCHGLRTIFGPLRAAIAH